MVSKDAVDAALTAHAQWKKRLQTAIATGQSEFKVEIVQKDNECQFGKWLYGLSPDEKTNEDFQKIKALHADFHRTAGDILGLALSGDKELALKKLDYGGTYGGTSGRLVLALQSWKSKM
jgi:hypothetical protein